MPFGPTALVVTSLPYVDSLPKLVRSGTRAIGSTLSSPMRTTLSMFGFAGTAASMVLPISRTTSFAAATEHRFVSHAGVLLCHRRTGVVDWEDRPADARRERLEAVDDRLGAVMAVGREQPLLRNDEQHVRVRPRGNGTGERSGVPGVPLRRRRGHGHVGVVVVIRNEYGLVLFAPL